MSSSRGKLPPRPDRNANEEQEQELDQEHGHVQGQQQLQLGARPKASARGKSSNYMELEFSQMEPYGDLPVSYATSTVTPLQAYREPAPPTPPPLSQIPSREARLLHSAPNTPSRGKVVLSKKERKELSKQLGLDELSAAGPGSSSATSSAQCSPYKGRVSELKNCLARGLFATLHRGSQKSLQQQQQQTQQATSSELGVEMQLSQSELSPPPPAPELANNNSEDDAADYTEKLKNLPVRQRKAATSHMDNYCLFDPVDFINEKALRYPGHAKHGLRDPLFSSRQHLVCEDDEELVPEVIYDVDVDVDVEEELEETIIIETSEEAQVETDSAACSALPRYEHHNYFVIDPDDFEMDMAAPTMMDIGIPNPYSNEQLVHAKLEQQSLETHQLPVSMSNSQESKDTETTSTALVESSTSTNSASSSGSSSGTAAPSSMKKKLTFLNLSPFRPGTKKNQNQLKCSQEQRAISELVTSEHMLHLQHLLLQQQRKDQRAHTVPSESNYVLFNPGPVPSRHVQYKIRKPRPLSTHSDADSGFLSPCSPDELKGNSSILVLQQCDSVQGYIEVSASLELNDQLYRLGE